MVLALAAFAGGAVVSLATSWLLVSRLERLGGRAGLECIQPGGAAGPGRGGGRADRPAPEGGGARRGRRGVGGAGVRRGGGRPAARRRGAGAGGRRAGALPGRAGYRGTGHRA